jgi:hypothetical protein
LVSTTRKTKKTKKRKPYKVLALERKTSNRKIFGLQKRTENENNEGRTNNLRLRGWTCSVGQFTLAVSFIENEKKMGKI